MSASGAERAFCATVEHGNFSQAAKALGVSPQAVSRAVARLEEQLGVVLFRRNTRHVEPTAAGQTYYEACRRALRLMDEAAASIQHNPEHISGCVRVSVPTTYGHRRFMPFLRSFRVMHPHIELRVEIDNHNVDFVQQPFDVAVRMGELADASFVARSLGQFTLGVFGHPDYLAERGVPTSVEDIATHDTGIFIMPRSGRALPWSFADGTQISPDPVLRVEGDATGLLSWAAAAGGLVQMYHILAQPLLDQGALVEVLTDHPGAARQFSVIYPRESRTKPAARVLIDALLAFAREQGDVT